MAAPRIVIATRPTEYEQLLARHATTGQARFFLETRGRSIEPVLAAHERQHAAVEEVERAVPVDWRRVRIARAEFARFLFEPDDLVVAVGQDGLVANVSKYLDGQLVIGVNPDADRFDGVLVRIAPEHIGDCVSEAVRGALPFESRPMVEARLDDGQKLVALNEVFVGHRTHQSARYRIEARGEVERQSSSGIVIATGTGATGWARSIARQYAGSRELRMPGPCEPRLVWFVREAFPSVSTQTDLTVGVVDGRRAPGLVVHSEFERGGVVFGDGIESDFLDFRWGQRLEVVVSDRVLRLVVGHAPEAAAVRPDLVAEGHRRGRAHLGAE